MATITPKGIWRGYIKFVDKNVENNKSEEPIKIFEKNRTLQSAPKISFDNNGQTIPTKPKIPVLYTLIEVKNAARTINKILYKIACFSDENISFESSLKRLSLGIKIPKNKRVDINKIKRDFIETSAFVKPPVKIKVIAYAFVGFVKIKKDIIELTKRLTDKPIKISFDIENFEKPLSAITKNALIIAPKNPNRE